MVRGPGKFKTKRGGGRSFSRHLTLDENGTAVASERRHRRGEEEEEEDSDDSEDDDDSEDESEDEEGVGGDEEPDGKAGSSQVNAPGEQEITRAERRAMKKAQKKPAPGAKKDDEDEEDEELTANTNRVKDSLKISDATESKPLSRREREAKEKEEAQKRYWKLHTEGKTDKAKADLARLAKIRAEREAAAAKREALKKQAEADKAAKEAKSGKRIQ